MFAEQEKEVYQVLKNLNIPYERVEHPPVFTCEEADSYIEDLSGVRSKSLFLTIKRKAVYYLVIMDGVKHLDIGALSEMIGEKHVSFASEEKLEQQLSTSSGMVSIFGLIHNEARNVQVIVDRELMSKNHITFHPNINTVTIQITIADMLHFVDEMGNAIRFIDLP